MLDTAKMKKDDLATSFICGMREREESKVKHKLGMVEKGLMKYKLREEIQ